MSTPDTRSPAENRPPVEKLEGPMSDPMLNVLGRSRNVVCDPSEGKKYDKVLAGGRFPIIEYLSYTILYRPKGSGGEVLIYDKDGILENTSVVDRAPKQPSFCTSINNNLIIRSDHNLSDVYIFNGRRDHPVRTWNDSCSRYDNQKLYPIIDYANPYLAVRGITTKNEIRVCYDKDNCLCIDYLGNLQLYTDTLPCDIEDNLVCDPYEKTDQENYWGTVYYCQANSPIKISKVVIAGSGNKSERVSAQLKPGIVFEKQYKQVNALRHIKAHGVFICEADGALVVIDDETGEELHKIPNFSHIHYEEDNIRGLDAAGHLIRAEMDFGIIAELKASKLRIKRLRALDVQKIVSGQRAAVANVVQKQVDAAVADHRDQLESFFLPNIANANSIETITECEMEIAATKANLLLQKVSATDIELLMQKIESVLLEKKKSLVGAEMEQQLGIIESAMKRGVTLTTLGTIQTDIARVRTQSALLTPAQVARLDTCDQQMAADSSELYRRETDTITKDMTDFAAAIDARLTSINGNKVAFDAWYANEWPNEQKKLRALLLGCPPGATDAYRLIRDAMATTDAQVEAARVRFEQEYAVVRQEAVERQDDIVGMIEIDMERFIALLDRQQFADAALGQAWVTGQAQYGLIMESIQGLMLKDAVRARELEHDLLSKIASTMDRKRRMEHVGVATDGHRTIRFGAEEFPIWERSLSEKDAPKVEVSVVFQTEHGQNGVKPADRLGKVMLSAAAHGKESTVVDVWHDQGSKADNMRMGLTTYHGADLPPSVMTTNDFKKLQKNLADWNKVEASLLRKKEHEFRALLHAKHNERKQPGEKKGLKPMDATWRNEFQTLLDQYGQFCHENNIVLLRQIGRMKKRIEAGTEAQSIGAVPKWQSHWVMDGETEEMLAELAKALKMQMRLQEGVANLKGHAGTGKDVLVKMLCHLSNRPYFAFDCSKWTTEYELGEDVSLVAENGVTTTIKVPSSVLLALRTPGAVLYFNEFNAMPEQSQIFLHSLFDEKRTITLKTSSGMSVKADPSVLFMSSMNPGYPGTFDPQMATRSRTVPIEVKYPALKNADGTYSSSEAWRIARGVESLFRLTLQGDASSNSFVKVWNREMNKKDEIGTPNIDQLQLFDLKVVAALVQFGNKLREAFMQQYDKGNRTPGTKSIKVVQPITGREMRRFADRLNQMSPQSKLVSDPEAVAKNLIGTLFLPHLDNVHDREEVKRTMQSWSVERVQ